MKTALRFSLIAISAIIFVMPIYSTINVTVGEKLTGQEIYIKHCFDGISWTWQKMTAIDSCFSYTGQWHGCCVNISTDGEDENAEVYVIENDTIAHGSVVTYTFCPTNGAVGQITITADNHEQTVEDETQTISLKVEDAVHSYYAYVWSSEDGVAVKMIYAGNNIYSVTVAAKYKYVIFIDYPSYESTFDWNKIWYKTTDLTIPTDNKLFYLSGMSDGILYGKWADDYATKTLYLNTTPWWWNTDSYYALIPEEGTTLMAYKMEKVLDYMYKVEIGKQYENIIFVRLSADATEFDKSKMLDITEQLTISEDADLFTIYLPTTNIYNDSSMGHWSKYDEQMYEKYYSFGTCGGNLKYYIGRNRILDIIGTGDMVDYNLSLGALSGWANWVEPWGNEIDSIHIDEGITKIGTYAFEDMGVDHLVIPSTVNSIGGNAIYGKNLKSLTCKAVTPPLVNPINAYPDKEYVHFCSDVDFSIPLYVPSVSVPAYKAADYWKDFTNILPIEGGSQQGEEHQPYDEDVEREKRVQPTAVDLGLPSGIRWSDISLGAEIEADYGNLYQWGCVTPALREGWNTYCYGTKDAITKYCTNASYGQVDNLSVLDAQDDAAFQTWGNGWRMPTKEEAQELWDYCTRQVETINGVVGYRFTGPNGNSVFMANTGWIDESGNIQERNVSGRYWTSSLCLEYNNGAYALAINDSTTGVWPGRENRHYARPIRGVLPQRICETTTEYNITLDEGETFVFSGREIIPSAGVHDYSVTLLSQSGCDSTVVWHVTVNKIIQEEVYYTINVFANSKYLGKVTGSGEYKEGANITITATANKGGKFVRWSDGSTIAKRSIHVENDATFTAIFSAIATPSPDADVISDYMRYDEKDDVINPFDGDVDRVSQKQNPSGRTNNNESAVKVIENGQIYIIKAGKRYTITGLDVSGR